VVASSSARAETPYDKINASAASSPILVHRLRGNVSSLEGSGGNIGVLTGRDGIFLVDTGISVSKAKIRAALRKLSPKPIRYAVDTHWHWDHSDGNGWVRKSGATLIASRKALERLNQTIRVVEWSHTFPPTPPSARPNLLLIGPKTMSFNGETILIRPYLKGHTDGDLSVYFRRADILQTGDTWWNGIYPFIDYVTGGSIDGAIRAANANLALATAHTIIIPGHGPIGNRAELRDFRDMLVGARNRVAALKRRGLSLRQTIAARPTASYDKRWGNGLINGELFTALVYRGV
jgi:glyoxylase-like metal-dependent hydrolase (beta-lactamase superfamily II)